MSTNKRTRKRSTLLSSSHPPRFLTFHISSAIKNIRRKREKEDFQRRTGENAEIIIYCGFIKFFYLLHVPSVSFPSASRFAFLNFSLKYNECNLNTWAMKRNTSNFYFSSPFLWCWFNFNGGHTKMAKRRRKKLKSNFHMNFFISDKDLLDLKTSRKVGEKFKIQTSPLTTQRKLKETWKTPKTFTVNMQNVLIFQGYMCRGVEAVWDMKNEINVEIWEMLLS